MRTRGIGKRRQSYFDPSGMHDNEIVDQLAKTTAEMEMFKPTPALVPFCLNKRRIQA